MEQFEDAMNKFQQSDSELLSSAAQARVATQACRSRAATTTVCLERISWLEARSANHAEQRSALLDAIRARHQGTKDEFDTAYARFERASARGKELAAQPRGDDDACQ